MSLSRTPIFHGVHRVSIVTRAFTILLLFLTFAHRSAAQNTILVTDLKDEVGSPDGCSLKDAIYSSVRHSNTAVAGFNFPQSQPNPIIVQTACVPGTGNDIIQLPMGAVLAINTMAMDISNSFGPTATPMISSSITIEGNGALLKWVPDPSLDDVDDFGLTRPLHPLYARAFAVSSTGNLTIRNIQITGFISHGGNGGNEGGGGGLGAGGAIYVKGGGSLTVQTSTFNANLTAGGDGGSSSTGGGGGGGGLGGNGGTADTTSTQICSSLLSPGFSDFSGGGGGGSFGDGGGGADCVVGGGGGGTITGGVAGNFLGIGGEGAGGFDCGGAGGALSNFGLGFPGHNGSAATNCAGGGGGGGSEGSLASGNGGAGGYGGGGGGGAAAGGNGGNGGFGGGGGAGWNGDFGGTEGGQGGFGGGGGSAAGGNITGSGTPGNGGLFGGNANAHNGGGGAALGGAIFNDGGTVIVQNSTFTRNFVTAGAGGGDASPGLDAGGAIFSRNGSLTIVDATIAANGSASGTGGGVVVVNDGATPNFTLDDTIIADNGTDECYMMGSVTNSGDTNLIKSTATTLIFSACPADSLTSDPLLGALQNNGGLTPTMSIPLSSQALNHADAATSLSTDQRGVARPQFGGFSIGAYEPCRNRFGLTVCPPQLTDTVVLTMAVTPSGTVVSGATTPPVGDTRVEPGSVVPITATPNPGFQFSNWSSNGTPVTAPTNPSTTAVVNASETVVANFTPLATTMSGNITAKSTQKVTPLIRAWTLSLTNNGPGYAINVSVPTFALVQTGGPACTPTVASTLPLQFNNIAPGASATRNISLNFNGCAANALFTATFTFTANSGAVSGTVVRNNQFQ